MKSNKWPIIVGGCHRSGTSLVRRLLNAHSSIHCGPEVKFFRDFYGDYDKDPYHRLRFFSSVRSILPEREVLELMGKAFVEMHEYAAKNSGKSRWADKNPENVLYLSGWEILLKDNWLFVHVVRNPLDTLASIKESRFPKTIPPKLIDRINFYIRYTIEGLNFKATYPDRYYCLIYEDLVNSPEETLHKLMDWLGEKFEAEQLIINSTSHQKGLEDQKIRKSTQISIDSVGRWEKTLSFREKKIIKRETKTLWEQIDPDSKWVDF